MNGEVDSFYRRVLSEIITDKTASILVCGGDITDKEVFASLGYLNVVISGMERRVYDYSPFAWREENVESLSLPDKSVDYTVIHAAIHHTRLSSMSRSIRCLNHFSLGLCSMRLNKRYRLIISG